MTDHRLLMFATLKRWILNNNNYINKVAKKEETQFEICLKKIKHSNKTIFTFLYIKFIFKAKFLISTQKNKEISVQFDSH